MSSVNKNFFLFIIVLLTARTALPLMEAGAIMTMLSTSGQWLETFRKANDTYKTVVNAPLTKPALIGLTGYRVYALLVNPTQKNLVIAGVLIPLTWLACNNALPGQGPEGGQSPFPQLPIAVPNIPAQPVQILQDTVQGTVQGTAKLIHNIVEPFMSPKQPATRTRTGIDHRSQTPPQAPTLETQTNKAQQEENIRGVFELTQPSAPLPQSPQTPKGRSSQINFTPATPNVEEDAFDERRSESSTQTGDDEKQSQSQDRSSEHEVRMETIENTMEVMQERFEQTTEQLEKTTEQLNNVLNALNKKNTTENISAPQNKKPPLPKSKSSRSNSITSKTTNLSSKTLRHQSLQALQQPITNLKKPPMLQRANSQSRGLDVQAVRPTTSRQNTLSNFAHLLPPNRSQSTGQRQSSPPTTTQSNSPMRRVLRVPLKKSLSSAMVNKDPENN